MSFSLVELQQATRNHGMPLEALRYPVTPIGLHYLLIHYDIPLVDPSTWRLDVSGAVASPASWSLDDLRALPAHTRAVTMECAGNGRVLQGDPRPTSQPWLLEAVGTGEWTGAPLDLVLEQAGVDASAVEVVFTGADRGEEGGATEPYQRSLPLGEALGAGALLAYELNGQPLPPQHGFPVRLVVPGWYGMANVKWLTAITAVTEPFRGYQMTTAYRLRETAEEPGEPLSRIAPRALMVPPGVPSFPSRRRTLPAGPCELQGRAWSGSAFVTRVEVSTDGGATWADAGVEAPTDLGAWQGWRFVFEAAPGDHELCARATDATGEAQPAQARWNLGGYRNHAVQRVPVTVVP